MRWRRRKPVRENVRVLLLGIAPRICLLYEAAFKGQGWNTQRCETVADAASKAKELKPIIIIVDGNVISIPQLRELLDSDPETAGIEIKEFPTLQPPQYPGGPWGSGGEAVIAPFDS